MKKQELPYDLFKQLLASVEMRYEEDCRKLNIEPIIGITARWGNGDSFDANSPNKKNEKPESIREMLLVDEQVGLYISKINEGKDSTNRGFKGLTFKLLYDFQNFTKDEKQEGRLKSPRNIFILSLLVRYIGFESWDKFAEQHKAISFELTELIKFRCYYYSFKSHLVKYFTMTFDESTKPIAVTEKGWHDTIDNELTGTATKQGAYVFVNLSDKSNGHQFQMTITLGGDNKLSNMNFMTASFIAVSTHGGVSSAQAIMVRVANMAESGLQRKDKLIIKRHLILKSNNFRIKNEYYGNVSAFRIVKKSDSKMLKNMLGVHRIWSYDRRLNIYQSFLLIRPDFRTYFYTHIYDDDELNKQVCQLRFSESTVPRLCITAFPSNGIGVLGFTMTEILLDEDKEIARGGFMTIGKKERNRPITGFIFMKKEPNFEDFFDKADNIEDIQKLKCGILAPQEIEDLIREDPKIEDLHKEVKKQLKKVKYNEKE